MAVEKEALEPGFPDILDVDANVRKVVKTLLFVNDMTADDLAEQLKMSRSTLYTRLAVKGKKSRFTVAEVYRMARLFNVTVGTFYAPPALVTGRYPAYGQVRAALDLVRRDVAGQMSLDDAPRYDAPSLCLVPIAT
jgi:hypothetical protein